MVRNFILFLVAIAAIVSNMKVIDYFYERPLICPQFTKIHGSFEQWKKTKQIKINYNDEDEIYRLCDIHRLEIFENYRVTQYLIVTFPDDMPLETFMELSQADCVESISPW